MIRRIRGREIGRHPRLAASMFRDRTRQFRDRLGWPVEVGADGGERDEYDAMDPLYLIHVLPGGRHGGSMRFLPTEGRCMVNDHFRHLSPELPVADPLIWECSRFCIAEGAPPQVAPALMLGALRMGLDHRLEQAIGVFDAPMLRVYRRLGWAPDVIGGDGSGRGAVRAGLWRFDPALGPALADRIRAAAGAAAMAA